MSVSASAITFGRCRGKGIGPVIGSGGGKASAEVSFAESGAAGCCGATDGGSGKTLGADAGAACTVTAPGVGGAADAAGGVG